MPLVNFEIRRCIFQNDSFSPFLFVLCMFLFHVCMYLLNYKKVKFRQKFGHKVKMLNIFIDDLNLLAKSHD